jgi:hypothetical protein
VLYFFVTSGDGELQNHFIFILFFLFFGEISPVKKRARNLAVILKDKTVLDINNC